MNAMTDLTRQAEAFSTKAQPIVDLVRQLRASRPELDALLGDYHRLGMAARPRDAAPRELPGDVLETGNLLSWLDDTLERAPLEVRVLDPTATARGPR